MATILHILHRDVWARVKDQPAYAPESLRTEGFIHCSTRTLVTEVANFMFKGRLGLLLLCIDTARLTAPLKFERVGREERWVFPHLYGPLNLDAVVDVVPFEPASDDAFVLPASLANC